jgi:gamma-glutamyltranspeptidase / glutathione hydrolase
MATRAADLTSGTASSNAPYTTTYKQEVVASRAVVAANHPLASAAGVEMLVRGGNAVDAAVATLFALSVVEPMMVSPFGAGFFMIRDGRSGDVTFLDDYAVVPSSARPDMFDPIPGDLDYATTDGANFVGYRSVATPGALAAWAEAAERFGRLPLATSIEPAIRFAAAGFSASEYLVRSITTGQADLAQFPASAEVFLPGGRVPAVGQRIVRADFARTLQQIADEGPETMYTGALARTIVNDMAANGGLIALDDLAAYRVVERAPVRGTYRGYEIVSTAPPSSGLRPPAGRGVEDLLRRPTPLHGRSGSRGGPRRAACLGGVRRAAASRPGSHPSAGARSRGVCRGGGDRRGGLARAGRRQHDALHRHRR